VSGTSHIFILFPFDVSFTTGIPTPSKVLVNSTAADAVNLIEGVSNTADTLMITVPTSVTIGNNSSVNVNIDITAGIQNASSGASLSYIVYTSVEHGEVNRDISLPVELTVFQASSIEGVIRLNWVTESEVRNAYWIVDRCEIPEKNLSEIEKDFHEIEKSGLTYEMLIKLNGSGTISERSEYAINDSSVIGGKIYAYRLADVSYEGVITRHKPIIQKAVLPDAFELHPNYPNPFNPETTIKYRLPSIGIAELIIYDVLGREVVTLVKDVQEAGYYKYVWNGLNHSGNKVSSGIYFYRLIVKNSNGSKFYNQVRKMIMLK
jgi:hypothetical protein